MFRIVLIALTASFCLIQATPTVAQQIPATERSNTNILRFEADNDSLSDRDSHYTSGWNIQYHSRIYNSWQESRAPELIKWIGTHVPTLNRPNSFVRNGIGFGQTAFTPADLSLRSPPENDLPYAGTLTGSLSWQNFDKDAATTFQITVGVLGDESQADQLQIYSHNDLHMGEDPKGWDSQRETEPIINIGYDYAVNLYRTDRFADRWAGQITLETAVALGNLSTDATVALGARYGWNPPEGFTALPAPSGSGLVRAAQLPLPPQASSHSIEAIVGLSLTALAYSVFYDGSLISGDDRDVDRDSYLFGGLVGINYHYDNSLSVRLYYKLTSNILDKESLPQQPAVSDRTSPDPSFAALIVDYHF